VSLSGCSVAVAMSGLFLGLTYGLSIARHEEWRLGRLELSMCVKSDDSAWLLAIAYLAEQMRHDCPFCYGNTINFGEPIASGSSLDGFVVFAPSVIDRDDASVDVGDDLPISIVGMYPTYASERTFIAEHGLEAGTAIGGTAPYPNALTPRHTAPSRRRTRPRRPGADEGTWSGRRCLRRQRQQPHRPWTT
jgi:hypothetical protein